MNTALSEMLHSLTSSGNPTGNVTDASMLERRRAQTKWQQEQLQQQQRYLEETDLGAVFSGPQFQGFAGGEAGFSGFVNHSSKVVPGLDNGWPELGNFAGGGGPVGCGFGINSGISRTTSYPPVVEASTPAVAEAKQILSVLTEKTSSSGGREGSKKRKADKNQNIKAIAEEDAKQKRVKECPEAGESKTEQNSNSSKSNTRAVGPGAAKREVSGKASKENSRVTEVKKPDYIHVRARRGQATDSHSLAERVRREKISERMKFLQELVPGCSKITGKAGMLDEIINYVQSLQRQVEFLSMKLAAVDPTLDFNIDDILVKEVFPACQSNFPLEVSSEMINPVFLQSNPVQQTFSSSCNGLEMAMEAPDLTFRRTICAPVSMHESFIDSSCFNYIQASSTWDTSLQSVYGVNPFPSLQLTGSNEVSNMKMEM